MVSAVQSLSSFCGGVWNKAKQITGGALLSSAIYLQCAVVHHIATGLKLIPSDPCFFWEEFRKGSLPLVGSSKAAWKEILPMAVAIAPPVEELIFRFVLQDLVLNKMVTKAIRTMSPHHADSWTESRTEKIARVALTALAFGAAHLRSTNFGPAHLYQAASAVCTGLIFGAIKESKLGLTGAIACHAMHNLVSMLETHRYCI